MSLTTTLPTEVENQIDAFMNKDQLKAFGQLRDVFRKAVLYQLQKYYQPSRILNDQTEEKSDSPDSENKSHHKCRLSQNSIFTMSKVLEMINRTNKKIRARCYNQILKHADENLWSDEIISHNPPTSGRSNTCDIFFTPTGFLQCFQVFPRSDLSKQIVCVVFKIASWVMICQTKRELKFREKIISINSDLISRTISPWKDFCRIKGLKLNHKQWGQRRKRYMREYLNAKNSGHIAKESGGVWYYKSVTDYEKAIRLWRS